jgi:hypothetical protein
MAEDAIRLKILKPSTDGLFRPVGLKSPLMSCNLLE